MVATSTIKLPYLIVLLWPVKIVIDKHCEKQLSRLFLQSKRSERRYEVVTIFFVDKADGKRMAAYLVVTSLHSVISSMYFSDLNRNWLWSTKTILKSLLWT